MWRNVIWLGANMGLAGACFAAEAEVKPAPKPVCESASETREEIKSHHLVEPFAALKAAQAQYKAEPLTARLCHVGDEYVYEIALLHRDGRFVHVSMNAVTGKWQEAHHPHDATPHETAAAKP